MYFYECNSGAIIYSVYTISLHGTYGVVNFIWKGRCSESISLRTKRCVYFIPNGAHYVPDPKPVPQKPGKLLPAFLCRFKYGGWLRRKRNLLGYIHLHQSSTVKKLFFYLFFCFLMDGSGSVKNNYESRFGSKRPKNIYRTDPTDSDPKDW